MASTQSEILQNIKDLQPESLSIIRISEPVSASHPSKRSSDASSDVFESPSPASLEADLTHYKDLFSKLRFSYLEQVTKEKFLRAIVGDPPLIVEAVENTELEAQLAEVKAILKEQKDTVAALVKELERRGRDLSRRYEAVELQTTLMERLPADIKELKESIERLREQNAKPGTVDGLAQGMNLPLDATISFTREKQMELARLNEEVKSLRQDLPRQTKELARLAYGLELLEKERGEAVENAREAVNRRKDGGETGDGLEMRGRWLKGCEDGLRGLLGVEA
ncbi:MAG: hypothetical protein LQ342_001077 [Letrouitia transgressa]|nr:MAG: hypothetical protein LQ342_001077 [Letrouitia transgressa]